jgi:hypothetical protein
VEASSTCHVDSAEDVIGALFRDLRQPYIFPIPFVERAWEDQFEVFGRSLVKNRSVVFSADAKYDNVKIQVGVVLDPKASSCPQPNACIRDCIRAHVVELGSYINRRKRRRSSGESWS